MQYFDNKRAEHLYLAHFKSSVPLAVSNPELFYKKTEALIVLGKHQFQRSFETLKKVFPKLTIEEYNNKRNNLRIT